MRIPARKGLKSLDYPLENSWDSLAIFNKLWDSSSHATILTAGETAHGVWPILSRPRPLETIIVRKDKNGEWERLWRKDEPKKLRTLMKLGILEEKLFNKIKLKTPKTTPHGERARLRSLQRKKHPPFLDFFAVIAKKCFSKNFKIPKEKAKITVSSLNPVISTLTIVIINGGTTSSSKLLTREAT